MISYSRSFAFASSLAVTMGLLICMFWLFRPEFLHGLTWEPLIIGAIGFFIACRTFRYRWTIFGAALIALGVALQIGHSW